MADQRAGGLQSTTPPSKAKFKNKHRSCVQDTIKVFDLRFSLNQPLKSYND